MIRRPTIRTIHRQGTLQQILCFHAQSQTLLDDMQQFTTFFRIIFIHQQFDGLFVQGIAGDALREDQVTEFEVARHRDAAEHVSRQHVEEDDGDGPCVAGPAPEGLSEVQFRRHVRGLAKAAERRDPAGFGDAERHGQVHEDDAVVVHHAIVWRHVAVADVVRVQVLEILQQLDEDGAGLVFLESVRPRDQTGERTLFAVRHDDVEELLVFQRLDA
mmetsp:Transcript_27073/g.76175  ORF Transcript_27073/g.76175 Transcript_27073/m.76175 type:complete len:216 (-) Transcript_27073:1138-1785(-)